MPNTCQKLYQVWKNNWVENVRKTFHISVSVFQLIHLQHNRNIYSRHRISKLWQRALTCNIEEPLGRRNLSPSLLITISLRVYCIRGGLLVSDLSEFPSDTLPYINWHKFSARQALSLPNVRPRPSFTRSSLITFIARFPHLFIRSLYSLIMSLHWY